MSTEGKKDDSGVELIMMVIVVIFFIVFMVGGGLKGCGDFLWYGSKGPPTAPLKW